MEKSLEQEQNNLIKIVLFGPESTGKTTLSRQLAEYYNTIFVPEYLREFAQKKWDNESLTCEKKDIIPIAKGQINLENKYAKKANKILICDTDLLETKIYANVYFEGFNNEDLNNAIRKNSYDLYLLTYIDTPWEADDLRDKPEQREEMFRIFENSLIEHHCSHVLLKGNKEVRLKKAIEIIDALLLKKNII